MMRTAAIVSWLMVAACEARPRTEVLLVVDAEPQVAAAATHLELTILAAPRDRDDWRPVREQTIGPDDPLEWPVTLGLVPDGGDASRRYDVSAVAREGRGEIVARARVLSGYVEGQTRELLVTLEDSCLRVAVTCEAGKTCHAGKCVPAEMIDPNDLPPLGADGGPPGGTGWGISDGVGAGTDQPFRQEEGDGIAIDPDGSITIGGPGTTTVQPLIWIANSAEGTVSRLDTRTREELGRYRTGGGDGTKLSPSRTAVNRDGHVVVSNRGFTSATRILASDCPDRDGDGQVRTSQGGTDVLPWGEDECVAWHAPFGEPGSAARATVVEERIGPAGVLGEYAWIGAYREARMYEIDTGDGALTGRTVDLSPVYPYGAALASGGRVWVSGYNGIASFDTTSLEVQQFALPEGRYTYGIAVDVEGGVWTGGSVQRLNPISGQWDWPDIGGLWAGGVAADAGGHVWAAMGLSRAGGIYRIDIHTLEATFVATGGREHGVAPDADGLIWGIDFVGTTASVIDPATLAFERIIPPFNGAYTYSDMTGSQSSLQSHDYGRYRHTFSGCDEDDETEWRDLDWLAQVPPGSHVTFLARTGDDPAALLPRAGAPLATVAPDQPPADIAEALDAAGAAPGRYLQIEAGLYSDDGVTVPRVVSFAVRHSCPDFIE